MLDFEITSHLYNVAVYYLLRGESRRSKAFREAAMVLDGFDHFVEKRAAEHTLTKLPGVGPSIANAVGEILSSGRLSLEDTLAADYPPQLAELAGVQGFGSRLLRKLSDLDYSDFSELVTAIAATGRRLPARASDALDKYSKGRNPKSKSFIGIPFPVAISISSAIKKHLHSFNLIPVGETRILSSRVRRIDFITDGVDIRKVANSLRDHTLCMEEPKTQGRSMACLLRPGIKCEIRYVRPPMLWFEVLKSSSPITHLDALRDKAGNKGLEWKNSGIFSGSKNITANASSEEDIYCVLDVVPIPPELRHLPLNESERVAKKLASCDDMLGDLHTHSTWSDGIDDLDKMHAAAKQMGHAYLAITDHSASLRVSKGLSVERVLRQHDLIDRHNAVEIKPKLLKGIEVEILSDGSLDYPNEILSKFDIVVAAVHTNTRISPSQMNQRILRAIRNPCVHILAHPTGRLTSRPGNFFATREPYGMDSELIARECADHHVALEINAFPGRLDLCSTDVRKAIAHGAKIAVGSDAHGAYHFPLISNGMHIARKAGCSKNDVLNTWTWRKIKEYLHSKPRQTLELSTRDQTAKTQRLIRSSTVKNLRNLFPGLMNKRQTVIGIDLTASEGKSSGWAMISGVDARTKRLGSDEDLIEATMEIRPDLVSIDSPLCLPYGRCCTDEGCECSRYGITRFCERFLMSLGIGVFPCLIPSMVQLTLRGIRLAKAFREKGVPVIESFPGAAQDILGIPRKQRGIEFLRSSLKQFGFRLSSSAISHDELDAITSALVGYFYLSNQYLGLGDDRENDLIVPSMEGFEPPEHGQVAIAVAGATGSGKTTGALYLALKYGFKYIHYSKVISEIAGLRGQYDKTKLQEAGLTLHDGVGQGEINRRLIDSLSEGHLFVIDGMRYPEDLEALSTRFMDGFEPVLIECSYKKIKKRLKKSPFNFDKSETQIESMLTHGVESGIVALGFQIPMRISNTSSFKDYYGQLNGLVMNM